MARSVPTRYLYRNASPLVRQLRVSPCRLVVGCQGGCGCSSSTSPAAGRPGAFARECFTGRVSLPTLDRGVGAAPWIVDSLAPSIPPATIHREVARLGSADRTPAVRVRPDARKAPLCAPRTLDSVLGSKRYGPHEGAGPCRTRRRRSLRSDARSRARRTCPAPAPGLVNVKARLGQDPIGATCAQIRAPW